MLSPTTGFGFGMYRQGWSTIPEPGTPKYLEFLADDRQFLATLSAGMAPNGIARGSPDAYKAIMDAAAANVGNLTVEERAQIIQSARMISAAGYRSDPTKAADAIVQNIERMSNNQGYTGPDAGVIVGTTPTAHGCPMPITRGQVLDNENFGNLVNSVFAAAGGKTSIPAGLLVNGSDLFGTPGSMFNTGGVMKGWRGIDITKLSECERMAVLSKVAEIGKDGTMSLEEHGQLTQMAMNFSNSGNNEPTAVTVNNAFGKPTTISKDDLMENGTFEKQLSSIPLLGTRYDSAELTALKDAIATADYDAIGYGERVVLIQAFNAATSDNKVSAKELAGLTRMLEAFQKTCGESAAADGATTLSNGLVVSEDDVASDDNFMSMVNTVLDRSGVEVPKTNPYGYGGSFSNNQYTVPMLRGLEVSKLTPEQRILVLEMISQAASDREVSQDEARNILKQVNQMSGRGSYPFMMA